MARSSKSSKNNKKSKEAEIILPEDSIEESVSASDDSEGVSASDAVIDVEATELPHEDDTDGTVDQTSADDGPIIVEETADGEAETMASEVEETATIVEETKSEIAPPPPPVENTSSGPSTMALVFGGLVAGGIGYGASLLDTGSSDTGVAAFDDSAIQSGLSEQESKLTALLEEVEAIKSAPESAQDAVDLSGIEGGIADLTGRLDGFEADISARFDGLDGQIAAVEDSIGDAVSKFDETSADLDARIAALEIVQPGGAENAAADDTLATFRAELDAMTSEAEAKIEAANARAAEIEVKAAEAAAAAEQEAAEVRATAEAEAAEAKAVADRQAAIAELKAALDSGTEFGPVIERLEDVPDVLKTAADTGVATLPTLQQQFPTAARAALSVAQTVPEDASAGQRVTAFLKRHTNARSLTPKDGSGADAILSRAEAQLGEGKLGEALAELEALPDQAKSAMDGWLENASTRAAAMDAVDQLSATK